MEDSGTFRRGLQWKEFKSLQHVLEVGVETLAQPYFCFPDISYATSYKYIHKQL